MLEFDNGDVKSNFMQHIRVKSRFNVIQEVSQNFVSDERIVWVDLEGIPIHAWSRESFSRICKRWGDMLNMEDTNDSFFGRKRLCIITKHPVSILEFFKIIVKGKDADQSQNNDESSDDNGSDIDGMADDKFDGNPVPPLTSTDEHEVQQSKDPFELYDLLKKNKTRKEIHDTSPSMSHPPGFTPLCSQVRMDNDQINGVTDG
nr:nucleotide-binding alpha-beta plait domain-containing protein [Tanacetum cinerariifolium]